MAKRKPQTKHITEGVVKNLRAQAQLTRAAFETATVQRVGQAFFIAAAQELKGTHGWTVEQATAFLTAVTNRTRDLLLPEKDETHE